MTASRPRTLRRWSVALLVVGLGLVLGATLTPAAGSDSGTLRWCLLCGTFGVADAIGNVALFVPLALGLRSAGVSGRMTIVLALLLSVSVELAQLFVPGRASGLGDIVANTGGAVLGAILWRWWPGRRSDARGVAAAAATLSLVAGTAWALRPSFPPTVYFGQWTAELGRYASYRGKVLSASIGGMALPSWRLEDSKAVRQRLSDGAALEVRGVAGPPPERLAPWFSIADDRGRSVLLLGPDRDDLVLQIGRRAMELGLNQPDLRWRGAMAAVHPGDSLAVVVRRSSGGYCLELNGRERCGLGFTAGRGWALAQFPAGLPAAAQVALDCAFMALLGLPVGLLLRRNAIGVVTAVTAVAGVSVLPSLVGLLPTPVHQVAALALGLGAAALSP